MQTPFLFVLPFALLAQAPPTIPPPQEKFGTDTHTNSTQRTNNPRRDATGTTGPGMASQITSIGEHAAAEKPPYGWENPLKENWPMLLVGAGATIAAFITLAVIKQQTKAANVSAMASRKSVEALIRGQRGWILIDEIIPPKDALRIPVCGESDYMIPLYFSCKLKVFGPTPCKVLNAGIRFHLAKMRPLEIPSEPDLPEVPEYRTNVYGTRIRDKPGDIPDAGTVVAPDKTIQMGVELESGTLKLTDVDSIREYKEFICAYGFVSYQDVFKRPHHTRFCYVYRVNNNRFRTAEADNVDISRFVIGGPAAYNEET
jgi:hypothetical protein